MGGLDAAMKKNIDHQLCPSGLDGQYYDKEHQNTSENVMRYKPYPYQARFLCLKD